MLQDVLDVSLLAIIALTLRAPLPAAVKAYLRMQFISVLFYLFLKLWPASDNYSGTYFYVYWMCTAIQFSIQVVVIWSEKWNMLRDCALRILAAGWAFQIVWYVAYFLYRSESLDWYQDAILGVTYLCLYVVCRSESRSQTLARQRNSPRPLG